MRTFVVCAGRERDRIAGKLRILALTEGKYSAGGGDEAAFTRNITESTIHGAGDQHSAYKLAEFNAQGTLAPETPARLASENARFKLDTVLLSHQEMSHASNLAKHRTKVAAASGAILEFIGSCMFIGGKRLNLDLIIPLLLPPTDFLVFNTEILYHLKI